MQKKHFTSLSWKFLLASFKGPHHDESHHHQAKKDHPADAGRNDRESLIPVGRKL